MKRLIALLLAAVAWLGAMPAQAEDIDLFASPPTTVTYLPNVLIVVDNTANWNTAFDSEKAALKAVFDALPLNQFRIGIMFYDETGNGNTGNDGAYVRAAIRTMDATNRPLYSSLINNLDVGKDKANGRSFGLMMAEAYLYYSGGTAWGGSGKKKRDYSGNTVSTGSDMTSSGATASNAVYALAGNAFANSTTSTYTSPVQDGCQRNFIIYIGNTTSTGNVTKDNSSQNDQAATLLTAANGGTPIAQVTNISPAGMSDNNANEWAQFMKSSTYAITTYTIDVTYGTNGNGPDNSALLESVANEGGGKYFKIDAATTSDLSAELQKDLGQILSEIQSVNSVFASVSLPVSVNTQGSYLNQVYIGMFRPDIGSAPRWAGNLKQYKLGLVGGNLKLQDANGDSAINSGTGFITECAQSYWTPSKATATDSYWAFKSWPTGTTFCLSPPSSATTYKSSNTPDGNIVEKGAQAYKLRAQSPRRLYTCGSSMAGCTALLDWNTTNVTTSALGLASTNTTEQTDLVNWAKGADVDDEDTDANVAENRPSEHGDIVHSRPVAVNFDDSATTATTSKVVVFYGGNDGMLRAINGNRGDGVVNLNGYAPGQEMWSFMPPEATANVKRLRDNTTLVKLASETYGTNVSTGPKPYGMDGPITAYHGTVAGLTGTKTFIYATMRRGGRSIYAFDVTDMLTSTNAKPAFKWRIGCSTALGAATQDCASTTADNDMSNMGQSWSSLKTFTTASYFSGGKPLLIFGGGYDTCEDYDQLTSTGANNNCVTGGTGTKSKGGSVYVVDANTGKVIHEFQTGFYRGVIADVTLVRDSTNNVILGYTADLGGNVYRIKFGTTDNAADGSGDWSMTRIAALGCADTGTCTANRKFMFAPSVATTDTISMNATYYVLLGSGDREKPISYYTSAYNVTNYFFQFQDKPGDTTFPGSTDCGANLICLSSLYAITTDGRIDTTSHYDTVTPTDSQLQTKKGWYLAMLPHEQVVTQAVTVYGVTTFSTHQPATASGSCTSNLGTTLVYNVNYSNAAPASGSGTRWADLAGDGLPPSPVAGQVTLDDGTTVPFCIGCSADSPLEGKLPTSLGSTVKPKGRLYWFIEK